MPLRLIGQDERSTVTLGGTRFVVRKVPHGTAEEFRRKFTTRGRIDERALDRALWLHVLVGWEELYNPSGALVPFSTELVPWPDPLTGEVPVDPDTGKPRTAPLPFVVAKSLPQDIVDLLLGEARGAEVKVHEALGNSAPSSRNA